jgi:hypothetical protein
MNAATLKPATLTTCFENFEHKDGSVRLEKLWLLLPRAGEGERRILCLATPRGYDRAVGLAVQLGYLPILADHFEATAVESYSVKYFGKEPSGRGRETVRCYAFTDRTAAEQFASRRILYSEPAKVAVDRVAWMVRYSDHGAKLGDSLTASFGNREEAEVFAKDRRFFNRPALVGPAAI